MDNYQIGTFLLCFPKGLTGFHTVLFRNNVFGQDNPVPVFGFAAHSHRFLPDLRAVQAFHGSVKGIAVAVKNYPFHDSASVIVPHTGHDAAEALYFGYDDGLHRGILRLESEVSLFFIKPFDRSFTVNHGCNDLPVVRNRCLFHNHDIAAENPGANHGIPFDAQGEKVLVMIPRAGDKPNVTVQVLDGRNWHTGGNRP
jgi:hypothetical protein